MAASVFNNLATKPGLIVGLSAAGDAGWTEDSTCLLLDLSILEVMKTILVSSTGTSNANDSVPAIITRVISILALRQFKG